MGILRSSSAKAAIPGRMAAWLTDAALWFPQLSLLLDPWPFGIVVARQREAG